MTLMEILPHPASSPSDELPKNMIKFRIGLAILSKARAAEACIDDTRKSFENLGSNPNPDESIALLVKTSRSLNQIFSDLPPQSDDEVVGDSWSVVESVRSKIQLWQRELEEQQMAAKDQVEDQVKLGSYKELKGKLCKLCSKG